MGEYMSALEAREPVLNVSVLAGHGTIRFSVMGDAPRKATESELAEMEDLMEESMSSGACGLSSGLRYTPSCYADESELVRLCRVVKRYEGVYATHMRSEGDNGDWEAAISEAAGVARGAGVPLQISHLKALSKNVWNTSGRALGLIERFRGEGLDVSCDQYPYDAAHTGLTVFLPQWLTLADMPALPADKREAVIANIRRVLEVRGGPERIIIVSSPGGRFDGKDISEISKAMDLPPEECIFRLILEHHGEISIISRSMLEEDIRRIMKAEYVMVASDGYSTSPSGPLAVGVAHPRSYGTFPRVIGEYVRERKVLTLEDAVRKMTSSPALKFRLGGRGRIAVGTHRRPRRLRPFHGKRPEHLLVTDRVSSRHRPRIRQRQAGHRERDSNRREGREAAEAPTQGRRRFIMQKKPERPTNMTGESERRLRHTNHSLGREETA